MNILERIKKNYFSVPNDLKEDFFREITIQNVRLFRYILGIFILWLIFIMIIDYQDNDNFGLQKTQDYFLPDLIILIIAIASFIVFLPNLGRSKFDLIKKDRMMNIIIFLLTIWSAYVNYLEELDSDFAFTLVLTYLLIIMLHSGPLYKYLIFTLPSIVLYMLLYFSANNFSLHLFEMKLPAAAIVIFGIPLYMFIYSTRVRNFLFRKKIFDAYRRLRKENSKRIEFETQLRNSKIELQEMLDKEKELNSLKIDFINMVSHQYRTPLTIILSSSYLLELKTDKYEDERINRHLDKIKTSAKLMTKLLENVITIGKNDYGNSEDSISNFSLIPFISQIFNSVNADYSNEHFLEILYQKDDISILTRSWHLRNILSNLFSNAIKFSPENKKIILRVVNRENSVDLHIIDDGIGIPHGLIENGLFSEFIRGKNVGTIPGFGLGMSIVKKSAEKINASIDIKSELNKGTEVKISLPKQ